MLSLTPQNSIIALIDWQERLAAAMPPQVHARNLERTAVLLRAARLLEIPVLVTEQYPKGLGPTVPELREHLPPEVEPVAKLQFSAARVPDFAGALTTSGRSHVVVVGMEAHVCVYQTARSLAEDEYAVHVPLNAVVSRHREDYMAAVGLYRQLGAVTTSVETVVFDWLRRAGTESFKTISGYLR
ncbi:MAG: hydrolase [Deltaproteobacteria bacterium]|nr:hydrolase [Deltaproteobacteria bacterium]